jgi:hypothetical protein
MDRRKLRLTLVAALAGVSVTATAQVRDIPDWAVFPADPAQHLADHRRIQAALGKLAPQRKGIVDAYVVVVSLNTDPVFGHEAREAAKVLSRRFDANGRTLVLAQDEGTAKGDAPGSPHHLNLALARVAEVMDRNEDVLILYSTSHGNPRQGLIYQVRQRIAGMISPARLAAILGSLDVRNRMLILQACYSGQFIPALANDDSIVITAAAADRSSFGCTPGNDWTFFGHALVNQAMRKPAPLRDQFAQAAASIVAWESRAGFKPSNPQISVGQSAAKWLDALERRAPRTATSPVGRAPSEIVG